MAIYRIYSLLFVFVFVFVFVACVFSHAARAEDEEVLSDDQAYSRAYTMCRQIISPFWMPKEGEAPPPPRTTDQRVRERAAIAKCMVEKNVPVKYDREEGIVLTGSNFGHNVHIKVEDMYPESVLSPDTISNTNPIANIDLNGIISPAEIKKSQDEFAEKMQRLTGKSILKDEYVVKEVEVPPMVKKVPQKVTPSVPVPNNNITAAPDPDNKNTPKPIFLGR